MELTNSTVKTAETESETPTRIQPGKPAHFTNGVLKRHAPLHLHHPVVVTYKECLKNHAATLGGHAVDGCGDFMPSPASNPANPTSLKCAVCGCHRNFHRREPEDPLASPRNAVPALEYHSHHRHHPPPLAQQANSGGSPNSPSSPPPISSSYYPSAPHMLMALNHVMSGQVPDSGGAPPISAVVSAGSGSRKRFRTKFTSDQKEKMLEFAERVDWKMQKRDEDTINEFCSKIGIDKGVFKVWMHNNKHNFAKKDHHPLISAHTTTASANGVGPTPGEGIYGNDNKDNIRVSELGPIHLHLETSSAAHMLGTTRATIPTVSWETGT